MFEILLLIIIIALSYFLLKCQDDRSNELIKYIECLKYYENSNKRLVDMIDEYNKMSMSIINSVIDGTHNMNDLQNTLNDLNRLNEEYIQKWK